MTMMFATFDEREQVMRRLEALVRSVDRDRTDDLESRVEGLRARVEATQG